MLSPNLTSTHATSFDGGGSTTETFPFKPEHITSKDVSADVEFANLYPAVLQCFAIILCG